jgi:protein lifeguard
VTKEIGKDENGEPIEAQFLEGVNTFTKTLMNPTLIGIVVATYFATACSLMCCRLSKVFPVNYILLAIFTVCVSYLVGIVCAFTEPKTVLMAATLTMAMFLALTIYACTTKTDFTDSFCGWHVAVIHITLIIFTIPLMFILHDRLLHLLFAYIGVAIFSFYIIYDTQMIMRGDRTNGEDIDGDYILAAVILYLDIINLFLKILEILKSSD